MAVNRRLAEVTWVACVLPGLVSEDTGSGEMKGMKYMNEATGLPLDFAGV